ncbi:dymeclin [Drosophila madeirensis]|uniref:Dymeclin n=2 Tax=obscura subgroup TaxID=32357 RepID=A0A3B0JKD6_DROGU|nr:dymeclin [Drosophila guanche]SPP73919.1 blast:Dymeclin [Drosophila guanche]
MGINVSRTADLGSNEWLQRFVGRHHIAHDDEAFWNGLLNYNIVLPENSQDQLNLDSRLETLCQSFIGNNLKTGNFGSLVTVFLEKTSELLSLSDQESNMHVWQTFNALFIIRSLVKYINETGSEFQLLQHFEALPSAELVQAAVELQQQTPAESATIAIEATEQAATAAAAAASAPVFVDGAKFETFIDALVNLIVVIPVKEFTYHLHLEAVNMLITLLSVHLFAQQPTEKSIVFRTVFKCQHANVLMSALLHFVARMVEVPHTMFGSSSAGSFVFGIAESLLSIFTFRKQQDVLKASNAVGGELSQQFRTHYPLANQSLLLILILTNHCTAQENAYRASLFGCADSKDSPKQGTVSFQIDFSAVYETLCRIVTIDQATLLLYLLLHRNERFYRFVMQQQDLEQLVIPILQTLYNAPDSNSHHIYMSLIVLLILSEDEGFNKNVHTIMLKNITWYTERTISEISLGGILILIVIRTIQYNMLKMRDKYLHTNCLAALANMSGHFRALHPYVAQRLVSLFETLARKHTRLDAQLKEPADSAVFVNVATTAEDMLQDLSVLEEVLRMVLEILNSCLTNQLVYCPNLVYTLLYKRSVFEGFRSHHAFQDVVQNIDMVVGFFSSRLQRVQEQRGELGVNEVLEVISKGASQWSSDRLRKFPDLKFKYVEEDAPEEFFIPYVWTLVCKYGCVHFSSESIKSVTTDIAC